MFGIETSLTQTDVIALVITYLGVSLLIYLPLSLYWYAENGRMPHERKEGETGVERIPKVSVLIILSIPIGIVLLLSNVMSDIAKDTRRFWSWLTTPK